MPRSRPGNRSSRSVPDGSKRQEPDGRFGSRWPRNPDAPLSLPFAVRFRRLHLRDRPEPQLVRAHVHDDLEMVLPTSGAWSGSVNRTALTVPAGGVVLVVPGDLHEDRCLHPLTLIGLSLELLPGPRSGRSASPLAEDAAMTARALRAAPVVHALARELVTTTREGGRWCALRQDAIAHRLLVELLAALPEAVLAPIIRERIAEAGFAAELDAVLHGLPVDVSVPGLAQALGLGERALQLHCRRLLGRSPLEILRRRRLEQARVLLMTGASVQEVAYQVGYAGPFHFSTAYRRAFGHPPSKTVRETEAVSVPRAWRCPPP